VGFPHPRHRLSGSSRSSRLRWPKRFEAVTTGRWLKGSARLPRSCRVSAPPKRKSPAALTAIALSRAAFAAEPTHPSQAAGPATMSDQDLDAVTAGAPNNPDTRGYGTNTACLAANGTCENPQLHNRTFHNPNGSVNAGQGGQHSVEPTWIENTGLRTTPWGRFFCVILVRERTKHPPLSAAMDGRANSGWL
jgi:hypothetical protein